MRIGNRDLPPRSARLEHVLPHYEKRQGSMIQYPVVKVFDLKTGALFFLQLHLPMQDLQGAIFIRDYLRGPAAHTVDLSHGDPILTTDILPPEIQRLLIRPSVIIQSNIQGNTNRPDDIPFPFSQLVIRGLIDAKLFSQSFRISAPAFNKTQVGE